MERCREIIMSDQADENKMTPARHLWYYINRLGKEMRISIMLPTTVKRYVLETWEKFEQLQEEFSRAVVETVSATFSTIITVDRLAIVIRLVTIRAAAKSNTIPGTRRVDADTIDDDASVLESADELQTVTELVGEACDNP